MCDELYKQKQKTDSVFKVPVNEQLQQEPLNEYQMQASQAAVHVDGKVIYTAKKEFGPEFLIRVEEVLGSELKGGDSRSMKRVKRRLTRFVNTQYTDAKAYIEEQKKVISACNSYLSSHKNRYKPEHKARYRKVRAVYESITKQAFAQDIVEPVDTLFQVEIKHTDDGVAAEMTKKQQLEGLYFWVQRDMDNKQVYNSLSDREKDVLNKVLYYLRFNMPEIPAQSIKQVNPWEGTVVTSFRDAKLALEAIKASGNYSPAMEKYYAFFDLIGNVYKGKTEELKKDQGLNEIVYKGLDEEAALVEGLELPVDSEHKCKVIWEDNRDKPLFAEPVTGEDIIQGKTGDCYMLGDLASLAQLSPTEISRIIWDNGDGSVTVRFHEEQADGTFKPFLVTVNKTVPYYQIGKIEKIQEGNETKEVVVPRKEVSLSSNKALWVQMIEKAYAVSGLHRPALHKQERDDRYNARKIKILQRLIDEKSGADPEFAKLSKEEQEKLLDKQADKMAWIHYESIACGHGGEILTALLGRKHTYETNDIADIDNIPEELFYDKTAQPQNAKEVLIQGITKFGISSYFREKYTTDHEKHEDRKTHAVYLDDANDIIDNMTDRKLMSHLKANTDFIDSIKDAVRNYLRDKNGADPGEDISEDEIIAAVKDVYQLADNVAEIKSNLEKHLNYSCMKEEKDENGDYVGLYTKAAIEKFNDIASRVNSGEYISCGTKRFKYNSGISSFNNESIQRGIVAGHEYTITGATEQKGHKFLFLRNPHGKNGAKYTRKVDRFGKVSYELGYDEDKSEFAIDMNDFLNIFCEIGIVAKK